MTDEHQVSYETRRRGRILGLAIDQSLTGVKNIIVFSDHKFWVIDDEGLMDVQKWHSIRDQAENILMELMTLEKKLVSMVDIYATLLPNNPIAPAVLTKVETETATPITWPESMSRP